MTSPPYATPIPPTVPSPTPVRFKTKRPRSPSTSQTDPRKRRSVSPSSPHESSHRPGRSYRHRHHHFNRRTHTPTHNRPDPSSYEAFADPDTAFRESLFDALADDEGAAYWEGVYGQPINTYSRYYPKSSTPPVEDDPENPKLERMTDEEYVSYVRAKMWEKSHGYIVEERRRRDKEREEKKAKEEQWRRWQVDVEEALRRGEERRKAGRWKEAWVKYVDAWQGMQWQYGTRPMKDKIWWPVESGRWMDVTKDEVERFFKYAPIITRGQSHRRNDDEGKESLREVLKKERVRWHPDKMQQRAGHGGIDVGTMKLVTSVFQVLDRLWTDLKNRT